MIFNQTKKDKNKKLNIQELEKIFCENAIPILQTENMKKTKLFIQHGNTSCYLHSISVAYYSLRLINFLNIKCDIKSLIRGALLHDYFLYDWHEKSDLHKLHGFTHPKKALENALLEYDLNITERDIILKHMFPLTPMPPSATESIIVCLVDKLCSIKEVVDYKKVHALDLKLRIWLAV